MIFPQSVRRMSAHNHFGDSQFTLKISNAHHSRMKRVQCGKMLRGVGRPRIISKLGEIEMVRKANSFAEQGRAFTKAKFNISLLATMKAEALARGENAHAVEVPKPSTLQKYRHLIVPTVVKKPAVQNERRLIVRASHCMRLTNRWAWTYEMPSLLR